MSAGTTGTADLPADLEAAFRRPWGFQHRIAARSDADLTIEQLLAVHRVQAVLTRYTYFYDGGDLDQLMTVFHPDCRVVNARGTYRGSTAIRQNYAFLAAQPVVRLHLSANVAVGLEDDSNALLCAYLYGVTGGEAHWGGLAGTYTAHLVKVDERWSFRNLRVSGAVRTTDGRLVPTAPHPPAPTVPETSIDWAGPEWTR